MAVKAGRRCPTGSDRACRKISAQKRTSSEYVVKKTIPGRSQKASWTAGDPCLAMRWKNAKVTARPPAKRALRRWNTFWVVQPYSGTRIWMRACGHGQVGRT